MEQLIWTGAPYLAKFMSSGLPCLLWVVSVASQTHQEMHVIDSFLQGNLVDIFSMTYACTAIEKFFQVHFYAPLKQLSKKNLFLYCFSNLNIQNNSRSNQFHTTADCWEGNQLEVQMAKRFLLSFFLDLEKQNKKRIKINQ